jgi:hypothetical protein
VGILFFGKSINKAFQKKGVEALAGDAPPKGETMENIIFTSYTKNVGGRVAKATTIVVQKNSAPYLQGLPK